jgi:predicted membrane protein
MREPEGAFTEMDPESRFVMTPRSVIGVCIALAGVSLTLDRLGLVEAGRILRFWPLSLVAVGGLMISQSPDTHGRVRGTMVAGIGLWIFLNIRGLVPSIWQLFWPVMLILIGTSLAFQNTRRRGGWNSAVADREHRVSMFSVWSGAKRQSRSHAFGGGDITAIMGGGQLDLRQADVAPGEAAVLDILVIMGGVEIMVPSHWQVETPIMPFLGAVEDKRFAPIPMEGTHREPGPRLILRGLVLMGGVEIKS